jgi:hypothetical protein
VDRVLSRAAWVHAVAASYLLQIVAVERDIGCELTSRRTVFADMFGDIAHLQQLTATVPAGGYRFSSADNISGGDHAVNTKHTIPDEVFFGGNL